VGWNGNATEAAGRAMDVAWTFGAAARSPLTTEASNTRRPGTWPAATPQGAKATRGRIPPAASAGQEDQEG
jgi:hypothetical protein